MSAFNAQILPLANINSAASLDPTTAATPTSVGLCLSGGGSRALSCALGQLRALHHLGLMDKVFAISSVSGGTWANSLYTYLPSSITDEDFLGPVQLDPSRLTVLGALPDALSQMTPNCLGRVPARLGVLRDVEEILKLKVEWNYPTSELWQGLIGHSVLRAYQLWQPDPKKSNFDTHFFSWTDSYLHAGNGVLARNPKLSASDFYTVQRRRPFPVFNTALFVNKTVTADLAPFEANFMLGVRQSFPQQQQTTIGGGFLESFAMEGQFQNNISPNTISVSAAPRRYTLADIVGSSSAAFAQVLEEQYPELNGVVPRYEYFPIANREVVASTFYRFADGGSLENLGLNVLLARGLQRILVGINTDEGIRMEDGQIVVSSDLPPLFGLQPYQRGKGYVPYAQDEGSSSTRLFRHNQVFPTASFDELRTALWQKRSKGEPIMYRQTLPVLANSWYGVPGNSSVEILWMYNDQVDAFWRMLSWEVKAAIDLAGRGAFPLYNTFTQLDLDYIAVNALAHLWCWNMASSWRPRSSMPSNAEIVQGMFK